MTDFPKLYTDQLHTAKVSHHGETCNHYFVLQGASDQIQPGGLPPPDWMVAVNPYGFFDAEKEQFDLAECFNADPDASLVKIIGVSLQQVQHALMSQAQADAAEHVQCDNGGLYAVWVLPDALILGGFDNGGSDIAQTSVSQVVDQLGARMVLLGGDSHFQLDVLRHNDEHGQLMGDERAALQLAEEILSWKQSQALDASTIESGGSAAGPRL